MLLPIMNHKSYFDAPRGWGACLVVMIQVGGGGLKVRGCKGKGCIITGGLNRWGL